MGILTKGAAAFLSTMLAAAPAFAQGAAAGLTRIGAAAAVHGLVKATAPGSQVGRVLGSGKPVYLNDHVTTDAEGHLQVMLLDETVFTLGPNSDMVLDEFVYDPNTNAGKVTAQVTKGVFRFVTGKVAGKEPSNMNVKLPVGTIGIRGTIVTGFIQGKVTQVVLGGPGQHPASGEKPGAFIVTLGNEVKTVSKEGFGVKVGPDGVSNPAPMSDVSKMIANALAASGLKGGKVNTSPVNNPTDASGQSTAKGEDPAGDSKVINSLSNSFDKTVTQANQDFAVAGIADGPSFWEQILGNVPTGSATFSGSAAFTQTVPSVVVGSWNYTVGVNFATKDITINSGITAGSITDTHSMVMPYNGLTGAAVFPCNSTFGTYTYVFLNQGGVVAKQLIGTASYLNGTIAAGTGVPIITTRP